MGMLTSINVRLLPAFDPVCRGPKGKKTKLTIQGRAEGRSSSFMTDCAGHPGLFLCVFVLFFCFVVLTPGDDTDKCLQFF